MNRMPFRRVHLLAAFAVAAFATVAAPASGTNTESKLRWHDARELGVEGKGWTDTQHFFDRLPAAAEQVVRPPVWNLSHDSAGLCVRFATDATAITARWTLRKESLAMSHMPASGVSGLDLYVRHQGGWRWIGAARPDKSLTTEKALVTGLQPERRDYRLYLPLYNGIEELKLGVPPGAKLETASAAGPGRKPVVFYGTSILQGGCASRPGMAYPAILGRRLDWPTINLGFSGNAHCEPEIAALLAELEPAAYVLDPLPNMKPEWVAERMEPFIQKLRAAHPHTPIVLVEHSEIGNGLFVPVRRSSYTASNAHLRKIHDKLVRAGDRRLFYVRGEKLLGDDGEGTVDAVHPTDLGFMRMADAIEPVLKRALKLRQ